MKDKSKHVPPKLEHSLEDRVKDKPTDKPTQPSKKRPYFIDLYLNIHNKHYIFEYSRSSDGTPYTYKDKITGLVMSKVKLYMINQENSKLRLGKKVYEHIQNRPPNASEDFNFYLKLEQLNKNPKLALFVTDEEGNHNKILEREIYRHLRRYRQDGLAVLSVPEEAGQVVQNGNPLSLYHPSPIKGFDWRKSPEYKWRTGLPVTPKA